MAIHRPEPMYPTQILARINAEERDMLTEHPGCAHEIRRGCALLRMKVHTLIGPEWTTSQAAQEAARKYSLDGEEFDSYADTKLETKEVWEQFLRPLHQIRFDCETGVFATLQEEPAMLADYEFPTAPSPQNRITGWPDGFGNAV